MHFILDPRSESSEKRRKSRYPTRNAILIIIFGCIGTLILTIGIIIAICFIKRGRCKRNENDQHSNTSIPTPPPPIAPRFV